uniref:Uncharacterized protein n=1 Tax=Panagrolaimus sp. ES5 TaxID=591445 RepID=A0AC34G4S6_9BILA
MIVQVLFAFALFVPALCDSIIQNPTFSFDFNPPISWTWLQSNGTAVTDAKTYPGQYATQADALRNMKNAIDGAILTAAQKLGYSTIGLTWTITGYNPQMMWIVDDSQIPAASTAYAGSYVPGLGAVISKRGAFANGAYAILDYMEHLTINVRGSALYSKSQWQTFADQVFTRLSIYDKVRFRSTVTIS